VTIFTIGHSVRPLDEFLRLLKAHDVRQLADVRTVPRSRRHPQFTRDALERSLPASGIVYRHVPALAACANLAATRAIRAGASKGFVAMRITWRCRHSSKRLTS
jgi:Uncharacterized conserved protein